MQSIWESLFQGRAVWTALAVLLAIQLLALYSAFHSLRHVRTSQAAVAWAIGLITLPVISLPLYWVFARNRFEGYREAIRDVGARHQQSVHAVQSELRTERYARSTDQQSALQRVADVLDTPISHNNQCELLIDGTEFFQAFFDEIEKAEKYIYLAFYIIRHDDVGNRLADALIKRAADGVQVRVLYDEVGCLRLSRSYLSRLAKGNVEVMAFNTRQGWVNRFQINFRNHRKLAVIDGQVAIVGGLNIGDEYIGETKRWGNWRDTGALVRGPAAKKVQAVFAGDYYWAARRDLTEAEWSSADPNEPAADGDVAICATGPADLRPRAAMMFSAAASAAKHRLWISTPYLVPDESSLVALHMAKARGVDVRVLIPSQCDHWGVYLAGFHYEQELSEADIPVYRYHAGFMHQKCVIIDDELAMVGSTNLDNRSLYLNFEMMLAIDDPDFVAATSEMLSNDFAAASHSNAPDAPLRWWFERAGTAVARLFSPIL